jgi:hypothetical protein
MAVSFNYTDYLLYAAATNVNSTLYSTVAAGVLGILENQYKVYTKVLDISYDMFISGTTFDIDIGPVNSITSITYDGSVLSTDDYSWYGRDVVLINALTDYRKPITLALNIGYTDLPTDLKLAIYRHIDSIIFAIEKHVDNVEKIINSAGNTAYYRESGIPKAVRTIYDFYSNRTIIS